MPHAWDEFCQIARQPRKRLQPTDGTIVASSKGSFPALAERLAQSRPAFLRHICPADHVTALTGDESADAQTLRKLMREEYADLLATGTAFSVQTRILNAQPAYKPYAINKPLSDELVRLTGATLDVRNPEMVLSVNIATLESQMAAFVGFSRATHNLSNWAGGERRYRRERDQISRAEFKLLEAFEWFRVKLPSDGIALDLGAAPGGWSRVVRNLETPLPVVAVDPGDLHPSLMADDGVTHVAKSAEIYLLNLKPEQRFSLLINDMRLDARRSAETMVNFAPYLDKDGVGIMTVKLPQYNPLQRLDVTVRILRKGYNIGGIKQLFHNRNEVTVLLKRK